MLLQYKVKMAVLVFWLLGEGGVVFVLAYHSFLLINTVEALSFSFFGALTSFFLLVAENSCLRPIDRNGKLLCPGKSLW